MRDQEGVSFLQWCLPHLHLRWPGFRKVRRQVYKRLERRLHELAIPDLASYRAYLSAHPEEWHVLDSLCRIHISRFYRDKDVFRFLEGTVLPALASGTLSAGGVELRCWCIGCAAGEEPYTLSILWHEALASQFPSLDIRILGTDVDREALERAAKACYTTSSVKDLPLEWRERAFVPSSDGFCLRDTYRDNVGFLQQDVRTTVPDASFHLILCRNVVFTYFDQTMQRMVLQTLLAKLLLDGALVIGKTESLPEESPALIPWNATLGIYRKTGR